MHRCCTAHGQAGLASQDHELKGTTVQVEEINGEEEY